MTKEEILESKSMTEVVLQYGIVPNRAHFIQCPFHTGDNHASLKIYDKSFYCFGCGRGGDIFTFVQLYENCDFHTAFLRLGGTDRPKGSSPTRAEMLSAYRAKRSIEARKEKEEQKKKRLEEVGNDIDLWRDRMNNAEPLSDEWTEAYNHWMMACAKQADISGDDLTQL